MPFVHNESHEVFHAGWHLTIIAPSAREALRIAKHFVVAPSCPRCPLLARIIGRQRV